MENLIVGIIIILLVAFSLRYILKSRKKGVKCIGCPYSHSCTKEEKGDCNN